VSSASPSHISKSRCGAPGFVSSQQGCLSRLSPGPVLDMNRELNDATRAAFQPRIQHQVGECDGHDDNAAKRGNKEESIGSFRVPEAGANSGNLSFESLANRVSQSRAYFVSHVSARNPGNGCPWFNHGHRWAWKLFICRELFAHMKLQETWTEILAPSRVKAWLTCSFELGGAQIARLFLPGRTPAFSHPRGDETEPGGGRAWSPRSQNPHPGHPVSF